MFNNPNKSRKQGREAQQTPQPTDPPTLDDMLGTSDQREQRLAVNMLLQPTISIVLTVDPKDNSVIITPISSIEVPPAMIQRILAAGSEELVRQLVAQAQEPSQPMRQPPIEQAPQMADTA
jgi:hypothetical protein